MIFHRFFRIAFCVFLGVANIAPGASAQSNPYSLEELAAAAMEQNAGGESALRTLDMLAAFDPNAALVLAKHYSLPDYLDAKSVAHYLNLALISDSESIAVEVGDMYGDPEGPIYDVIAAVSAYEVATEHNSPIAVARLGRLFTDKNSAVYNLKRGLEYYKKAISLGSGSANTEIGDLFRALGKEHPLYEDPRPYYIAAAELGESRAYSRLGDIYRDGTLQEINLPMALDYYNKALAAGNKPAGLRLAKIIFNSFPDQRERGVNLARTAVAEKVPGAAAVLADALWKEGGNAALSEGIDILEQAAEWDGTAADKLVQSFLRGSASGGPQKNLKQAAESIVLYRDVLSSIDLLDYNEFLLMVAKGSPTLSTLVESFTELSNYSRIRSLPIVRSINMNTYVAITQKILRDAGLYDRNITGILDSYTISAFQSMCLQISRSDGCLSGPLSLPARDVLIEFVGVK